MTIKNCMEDTVESYVDNVMKELDMCSCEKCRNDVMAIALNHLPPQYTATRSGLVLQKVKRMELQFDTEVISELTKAAKIVMKDARHYDKEEE